MALKKLQSDKIAEIASQLIEKGQNASEVMDAVEKKFEKINKSRVKTDGSEEIEKAEKNEMQQILSGYVDYMKKQLTEELEKLRWIAGIAKILSSQYRLFIQTNSWYHITVASYTKN